MSKVVLITGAAKRIGAVMANTFHQADYRVIVHYRHSHKDAKNLVKTFNAQKNNTAVALQADLDDAAQYQKLIADSISAFGQLDVFINNASTFFKTPLGTITETDWELLFNSNLKAPLFLSQTAAPYLKKSHGTIINIVDIDKPKKNYLLYHCAKTGLAMLTKSLALELAPDVRVNAIAPGHVIWPEDENAFSENEKKKILADTLLQKNVAPEDIAKTALFLAEQASMTGQIINVDGGRV